MELKESEIVRDRESERERERGGPQHKTAADKHMGAQGERERKRTQ